MAPRLLVWVLLPLALATQSVRAGETLHMLVDSSTEMPQARIVEGVVVGGLARDLGLQLSARLNRPVRLRVLPRKRVAEQLMAGVDADLLCNYLPEWLPPGPLWSQPFIPDAELLISTRQARAPQTVGDLAGQPIGTISGFIYPTLEGQLGETFMREDAPNAQASLRKLQAGRMQHAVIGRMTFDYLVRSGNFRAALHPSLEISSYKTHCALSPRSKLQLGELNLAISALIADGGLKRMLDAYR